MKNRLRFITIPLLVIGLISIWYKTCRSLPKYPVAIEAPVPADTAANCFSEPFDVHSKIGGKWFWVGVEHAKYSNVNCFLIDTSGYSDANARTGNWIFYNEGSMDKGGPASWSRCSYSIDSEKTLLKLFDFKENGRVTNPLDTIAREILRLDDKYLIVYDHDTSLPQQSYLYVRRSW